MDHLFIASGPARGEDRELDAFLDADPPLVPLFVPRCESGGVVPVACISRLLEASPDCPPAAR